MPLAPELSGGRLALVIATTTYTDPALRQLRAPAQDAAQMVSVLADPAIGAFTVTDVIDQPEYELRRAIDTFLADRVVDDLVLIYLSCHGVRDARGRLHFAATDTRKDRLSSTSVDAAWLLDRLEECRARRQVVILDCCFSGAFAKSKGGVDLESRLVGSGRGRAVLTASRAEEYSYEGTPLTDETHEGSVFTAGLIKGLRTGQADHDADGYVTVEDAYSFAADHVLAHGANQSPQRWLYGAEGQIVLARNPHGATVTPTPLPEALRLSLDSPYPEVRLGAVRTLGAWLAASDPREVLAAQQALHLVASQDSPAVAAAARGLLPIETPPASPEPLVRTIASTNGSVHCVAFSPDGTLLASANADKTVRLWDPKTGDPAARPTLGDHYGGVRTLAFGPESRLLASGSDHHIFLWDLLTGLLAREPLRDAGRIFSIAISPNGLILASGTLNGVIQLWDLKTRKVLSQLVHSPSVVGLTFSPDGGLLASASRDGTIRLWDPNVGRLTQAFLRAHSDWVNAVAFSPGGTMLASASHDRTIALWDLATGSLIRRLEGHAGPVRAVAFSPNSQLLVSGGGGDNSARLWDVKTGAQVGLLQGHTKLINSVAFSPDGQLIASGGKDGQVRLWRPQPDL